jgi:hypothetical protein
MNTKVTLTNQEQVTAWVSSFLSGDFDKCDATPQTRNFRIDPSVFTQGSSEDIYSVVLNFLVENSTLVSVESTSRSKFLVTIEVPVCDTTLIDFNSESSKLSSSVDSVIESSILDKTNSDSFTNKNLELVFDSLIQILNTSKTEEKVKVTQELSVEHDSTLQNTKALVYKLISASKVNDVLQAYVNSTTLEMQNKKEGD